MPRGAPLSAHRDLQLIHGEADGPEREAFTKSLAGFMRLRGTPLNKIPSLGGRHLDLFRLCAPDRQRPPAPPWHPRSVTSQKPGH